MEKWLCWSSLGVSSLMLLFFVLDMALGIPFGGLSKTIDIFGILASGILVYLSYNALRDVI